MRKIKDFGKFLNEDITGQNLGMHSPDEYNDSKDIIQKGIEGVIKLKEKTHPDRLIQQGTVGNNYQGDFYYVNIIQLFKQCGWNSDDMYHKLETLRRSISDNAQKIENFRKSGSNCDGAFIVDNNNNYVETRQEDSFKKKGIYDIDKLANWSLYFFLPWKNSGGKNIQYPVDEFLNSVK